MSAVETVPVREGVKVGRENQKTRRGKERYHPATKKKNICG